jgi:hypothetical protein
MGAKWERRRKIGARHDRLAAAALFLPLAFPRASSLAATDRPRGGASGTVRHHHPVNTAWAAEHIREGRAPSRRSLPDTRPRSVRVVVAGRDRPDQRGARPAAAEPERQPGPAQIDLHVHTRPDQGDRLRLWNLANRIPADQRFTRRFEGRGELIDHILVSHTLLNPLPMVEVIRQTGLDQLPSITTDAAARRSQPASDHAAVLAHLQL